MIDLNIIEPVQRPTDWVNALVVVEIPNGKLRVCLDSTSLSKATKPEGNLIFKTRQCKIPRRLYSMGKKFTGT